VGESTPPVGGGNGEVKEPAKAELIEKMVEDWERAEAPDLEVQLRRQIIAYDYVCSGTLSHRTMRCGQPSCRCRRDPAARHGPYYHWTRMECGKLANRSLTPAQAEMLRAAIANLRKIRVVLQQWERETLRAAGVQPTKKR
jgi:hypothetical protein